MTNLDRTLVPQSVWKSFCKESRSFFCVADPRLAEEGKNPVVSSVFLGLIALGADIKYLQESPKLSCFENKRASTLTRLIQLGYITKEGPQRTKILNLIIDYQSSANALWLRLFETANQQFFAKNKKQQVIAYRPLPLRIEPKIALELPEAKSVPFQPIIAPDQLINAQLTPEEFALAHYVNRHLYDVTSGKAVLLMFSEKLIQDFVFDGKPVKARGINFARLKNKLKSLIPQLYPSLYGNQVKDLDNWNKSSKLDYVRFKEGLRTFCSYYPLDQVVMLPTVPDYNDQEPEEFTAETKREASKEELQAIVEVETVRDEQIYAEQAIPDLDSLEDFEIMMFEGLLQGTFGSISTRQRKAIAAFLVRPGAVQIVLNFLNQD
jgi:hypothetical protein